MSESLHEDNFLTDLTIEQIDQIMENPPKKLTDADLWTVSYNTGINDNSNAIRMDTTVSSQETEPTNLGPFAPSLIKKIDQEKDKANNNNNSNVAAGEKMELDNNDNNTNHVIVLDSPPPDVNQDKPANNKKLPPKQRRQKQRRTKRKALKNIELITQVSACPEINKIKINDDVVTVHVDPKTGHETVMKDDEEEEEEEEEEGNMANDDDDDDDDGEYGNSDKDFIVSSSEIPEEEEDSSKWVEDIFTNEDTERSARNNIQKTGYDSDEDDERDDGHIVNGDRGTKRKAKHKSMKFDVSDKQDITNRRHNIKFRNETGVNSSFNNNNNTTKKRKRGNENTNKASQERDTRQKTSYTNHNEIKAKGGDQGDHDEEAGPWEDNDIHGESTVGTSLTQTRKIYRSTYDPEKIQTLFSDCCNRISSLISKNSYDRLLSNEDTKDLLPKIGVYHAFRCFLGIEFARYLMEKNPRLKCSLEHRRNDRTNRDVKSRVFPFVDVSEEFKARNPGETCYQYLCGYIHDIIRHINQVAQKCIQSDSNGKPLQVKLNRLYGELWLDMRTAQETVIFKMKNTPELRANNPEIFCAISGFPLKDEATIVVVTLYVKQSSRANNSNADSGTTYYRPILYTVRDIPEVIHVVETIKYINAVDKYLSLKEGERYRNSFWIHKIISETRNLKILDSVSELATKEDLVREILYRPDFILEKIHDCYFEFVGRCVMFALAIENKTILL